MEGVRLPYPHPDWKACDFFQAQTVGSSSEPYYTSVWKTRPDSVVVPVVESDEVYVLNSSNTMPPLLGSRGPSAIIPAPGFEPYSRVGSTILWKRIVLRLWLETSLSVVVQPEHLRVSLVYSRIYNGSNIWGSPWHYPARWQDVYLPCGALNSTDPYGTHNELNRDNMRNVTVLKEWFFTNGCATHLDPLDNLNDVKDFTQVKTFVCEMDLPDLPHVWECDNPEPFCHPKCGKGDLLLLVNSSEVLDEGIATSRFRLRFSGRLYFVDAQ